MTLIKCTIRRILFATTIFMLVGSVLSAKGKLTLEGQVVDEDGEKVKKAELTLRKDGDVVEVEIEQVGLGVELGLGVAAGDTPEESPVRGHGLADGGGGLSLAPSRAVIDDVVLRSVGDADTEVRKNTAEFLAERDVDGFAGRHSAVADAAAVIVNTQCTKVAGVSATGHPTGKPVDHGQSILPRLDRMK